MLSPEQQSMSVVEENMTMGPTIPMNGSNPSMDGEWIVTMTHGVMTKIERYHSATQTRHELSPEEYAWVHASHEAVSYLCYYAGIRDYANAIASGNVEVAQAYYKGMADYLGMMGQM
jgi:hypothetical protein